jgi:hypothetical protein
MAAEPTLSSLAILAESAQPFIDDVCVEGPASLAQGQKTKEQLRRHYIRTLHKVIEESDIIVLVLDARDPEGCRSRLVEEEVRRREHEGKKLVFVLNKIGAWIFFLMVLSCHEHTQQISYLRITRSFGCDTFATRPQLYPSVPLRQISAVTSPRQRRRHL